MTTNINTSTTIYFKLADENVFRRKSVGNSKFILFEKFEN